MHGSPTKRPCSRVTKDRFSLQDIPVLPTLSSFPLVTAKLDETIRLRSNVPGPLKQPQVMAADYRLGDANRKTELPE